MNWKTVKWQEMQKRCTERWTEKGAGLSSFAYGPASCTQSQHSLFLTQPSLWLAWELGVNACESARSAEAATEAALGSHKSLVTAHLPAWGITLPASATSDPQLVAVLPQDTQWLSAELILLSKTGKRLFTAGKMTANKPNKCSSEELPFCLRKNDEASNTNMHFWKASNSSPRAYSGTWNPPSGRGQVSLLVTLLYTSRHLLLTSVHHLSI